VLTLATTHSPTVVTHYKIILKKKEILEKLNSIFLGIFGILFFLGLFTTLFGLIPLFRDGIYYFSLVGLIMILPFFLWAKNVDFQLWRNERKFQSKFNDFKSKAERVNVDLEKVKVQPRNWYEKIITDNSRYAGLNDLVGRSDRNFKIAKRTLNHISLKIPYNGQKLNYRTSIAMDNDTLKIHFALQKQTTLYIDPNDRKNIYLDLEFLKK